VLQRGRWWMGSSRGSGAVAGVSADAGDGDCGADRLPYSIRTLSGRVAELRPAYLLPDPASRTAYAAGEVTAVRQRTYLPTATGRKTPSPCA
jgi:hypothetical protein